MKYQRPTDPSTWEAPSPHPPNPLPLATPQALSYIRYKRYVLWLFTWTYVLFCICFTIGYAMLNSFFLNLGMSLFLGLMVSILVLDARNAVSLQGWMHWKRVSGKRKILLVVLFCCLLALLPIPYLWRTHLAYQHNPTLLVNRKARSALIIGLCTTVITYFIGVTYNTTSSALTPSIMQVASTTPTTHTLTLKPTPVPFQELLKQILQGANYYTLKGVDYNGADRSVEIRYYWNAFMDDQAVIDDTKMMCFNAQQALWKSKLSSNFERVTVVMQGDLFDKYGNKSIGTLGSCQLSKATARNFNWDNLSQDSAWEVYDGTWLLPSLKGKA